MSGIKRVFWVVLDGFGIGAAKDAAAYGDVGSNTLKSVVDSGALQIPNLTRLGLFNIAGAAGAQYAVAHPQAAFARMEEASKGKDTTTGHWEMAGIVTEQALPLYPHGFPPGLMERLQAGLGRALLCNKPYSGTAVIHDYGQQHMETGALIVYTSADSICQIAAHEDIVPPEELYRLCQTARALFTGEHAVARIIARPFVGAYPDFKRTAGRRDFSLPPPKDTVLDLLSKCGKDVVGVGKISDIFSGHGVTRSIKTKGNIDGMEKTIALLQEDFSGLAFVNLVDFDMLYGHRSDVPGYAAALNEFDGGLGRFLAGMGADDALVLTADHGCDPGFDSTDHTREDVPMLLCGQTVKTGLDLGVRHSFADIGATVMDMLGAPREAAAGESFWPQAARNTAF